MFLRFFCVIRGRRKKIATTYRKSALPSVKQVPFWAQFCDYTAFFGGRGPCCTVLFPRQGHSPSNDFFLAFLNTKLIEFFLNFLLILSTLVWLRNRFWPFVGKISKNPWNFCSEMLFRTLSVSSSNVPSKTGTGLQVNCKSWNFCGESNNSLLVLI